MRRQILAIALCLVMVSAFAVTASVSAKNDNNVINTSIRQYDVMYYASGSETGVVVGKVTIDGETGHYIVNVNFGRAGLKDIPREGQVLWILLSNANSFGLLIPTFVNAGGIGHVQYTHELIPQWFNSGAVDKAPTDVRFYCFDCLA